MRHIHSHKRPSLGPLSLPPHLLRGLATGVHASPLCPLTSAFTRPPTSRFLETFYLLLLFPQTEYCFYSTPFKQCCSINTCLKKVTTSSVSKWMSFIFIYSEISKVCVCASVCVRVCIFPFANTQKGTCLSLIYIPFFSTLIHSLSLTHTHE